MSSGFDMTQVMVHKRPISKKILKMLGYVRDWDILPLELKAALNLYLKKIGILSKGNTLSFEKIKFLVEDLLRKCCKKPISYMTYDDIDNVLPEILCHIRYATATNDITSIYSDNIAQCDIDVIHEKILKNREKNGMNMPIKKVEDIIKEYMWI